MIGVSASLSQNAYSPSNDTTGRAFLITGKGFCPDGSQTGVVFCHGAGGSEADVWSGGQANFKKIIQAVARTNPVVGPAFTTGGDKWGNDLAISQTSDAVAFLGVAGARTDRVMLIARSMGALYAMGWARQNVSKIAGILTFSGVANLQAFRDISSNTAGVDAAYSGGYSDAVYGAAHNPTVYASDLSTIPTRLYYATDDTTVAPATTIALAAALGANAEAISMGTGGHTDTPLANIDLSELLDWIDIQVG